MCSVGHKLWVYGKVKVFGVCELFCLFNIFPIAVLRGEVQFRWSYKELKTYITVAARTMRPVTCDEGPTGPEAYVFQQGLISLPVSVSQVSG